jgi:hypothetical protein
MIIKLINTISILATACISVPVVVNLESSGTIGMLFTSMMMMFLIIFCFIFIRDNIRKQVDKEVKIIQEKTVLGLITYIKEDSTIRENILDVTVLNGTSTIEEELNDRFIQYYNRI